MLFLCNVVAYELRRETGDAGDIADIFGVLIEFFTFTEAGIFIGEIL